MKRNVGEHGLTRPNKRSRKYKAEGKDQFLENLGSLLKEEQEACLKEGSEWAESMVVLEFDPTKESRLPSQKTTHVGDLTGKNTTRECAGSELQRNKEGDDEAPDTKRDCSLVQDNLPGENQSKEGLDFPSKGNLSLTESNRAPVDCGRNSQDDEGNEGLTANGNLGLVEPTDANGPAQNMFVDTGDLENSTFVGVHGNGSPVEMASFKNYIEKAKLQFGSLSRDMKSSIELMDLMNTKGGSVALFDAVLDWHMKHLGQDNVVRSKELHTELINRYNLGPTLPKERTLTLPYSGEIANLACHDAKAQLVDLLTDPRLCDDDYLFLNDDPEAGIPEEFSKIADVNTGLAYRETHKKLIEPAPYSSCGRRRVLCPIIFYIDGCVAGQFMNLNIEILKFTIGLFKGKTRCKDWAWRNLGYVKKRCKRNKKAEDNIKESNHTDAPMFVKDGNHRGKQYPAVEGPAAQFDWKKYSKRKKKPPRVNAQDYHAMLRAIMQPYKELQDIGGLEWDLRYRGKTHELVLVPFILMLKADSVEADKACGQCGSKTKGVKAICRHCCIPTNETDNPYIYPPPERKTKDLILPLLRACMNASNKEEKEAAELKMKEISQHRIMNAFYDFDFGLHDNSGIHGATPWEVLHWILLGFYKYDREALFLQTGEHSKLTRAVDALAQTFGHFLDRQSDQTLPRVSFNDGVREGKMQGHEMVGVMLLLVLALRSRAGRDLILDTAWGKQKNFFPHESNIKDWVQLLESHLMFERWLRKEEFSVQVLEKAKTRLRDFLHFTKSVGQRSAKMGYCTANFHGTLHMPEMALNLGAFTHQDGSSNESHHKKDKKTAGRTNKQLDSFDISHANHSTERHAVELGIEEMEGTVSEWDYYKRGHDIHDPGLEYFAPKFVGPRIEFTYNEESGKFDSKIVSRMTGKEKYVYDPNTCAFVLSLAAELQQFDGIETLKTYGNLHVYSPSCESGVQIFHAMPHYRGKPWHDWAIFDMRDPESEEPEARSRVAAHIKCFLDLRDIPPQNSLLKPPGLYAVIEPTKPNPEHDEKWWSRLLDPICEVPSSIPGYTDYNHQELISIDKLLDTAVVVPDHANPNQRAWLRMVPMSLWAEMFEDWIMLHEEL